MLANIGRGIFSLSRLHSITVPQRRTISSSHSRDIKELLTSKLIVAGTVAGGVGLAIWRYTASANHRIEEAVCEKVNEEERSEVMPMEKFVPKNGKQTDGSEGDYERRLQDAIAKSRDLLYRAKVCVHNLYKLKGITVPAFKFHVQYIVETNQV